jgi:ribonucleoside-diphosphate reductase beta chain
MFDRASRRDYDLLTSLEFQRTRVQRWRSSAHESSAHQQGDLMTATLEQLAQQGDPGTLRSDEQALKLKLMTPQQLYELWERQQWLSQEIDLSQDREDWARLDDFVKEQALWGMSAFFIGEERVTTQFSALVMAYENEQEEAFLATQQVDEARHMQFFDRLFREVIGYDDPGINDRLQRVRKHVNNAFVELFDVELVEHAKRLIENPDDLEAKVDFVTAYHMVIEGTLALTGQEFMTRYWVANDLLPGFVEGFGKIARDEHRHVAYGTWFLKETAGNDLALADRMRQKLIELLPIASEVLVPVGFKHGDDWEVLGYTAAETNEFAFQSLARRLKAIGVPLQAPVSA